MFLKKYSLIGVFATSVIFSSLSLVACGDSADSNSESKNESSAWVWAFDDDETALKIYDPTNGDLAAEYEASAFSKMHVMLAGSEEDPTVWMANSGNAYSFTTGFSSASGEIVRSVPEEYAVIELGNNPVHMGKTPSGDSVSFSNDGDQTVSVIDVASADVVQTVSQGSGHSAALIADGYAVTTAATGSGDTWAKITNIAKDSLLDSLTIGAGAHGDAYYAENKQAFISCEGGIYVVSLENLSVIDSILYTEDGRTNFMYHGESSSIAIGLHKTESGQSDKVLLLDMINNSLEYLTIDGAAVNWQISLGQFALAEDGVHAVLSDLEKELVYVVNLETRDITTLTSPAIGVAVAINADGSTVWVLDETEVSMISVSENTIENTFNVAEGTDWIFVTSSED